MTWISLYHDKVRICNSENLGESEHDTTAMGHHLLVERERDIALW